MPAPLESSRVPYSCASEGGLDCAFDWMQMIMKNSKARIAERMAVMRFVRNGKIFILSPPLPHARELKAVSHGSFSGLVSAILKNETKRDCGPRRSPGDRKSTRLNSSHVS